MSKNKFYQLKRKKSSLFFLVFCFICMIVAISIPVFAKEEPVKSITIESEKLNYEENKPGSYKITKQAEWIGKGKARITFQVDTKELIKENINTDTILIIDTSGSMTGDKLDKVKSDSIDLINKLLENPSNRLAMIEFNTEATILSDFTNNASELSNKINNLQTNGETNYYQALVKLDELLKTYQKEENRELTVLFLTDGYPCRDTPNEVGQYNYLKSEYPYLNVNGIQYEMGNTILEAIKNISDKQYNADMNTLNNVLIDASSLREEYNDFKITDYINTEYFKVEDKEDITTSIGDFTLDKNSGKVTWNLDGLSSGTSVTMTIDVYLKEEYIDQYNLYETNTKEEVTSEIKGIKENINKTDTPMLSNSFTVTYDENAPDGCKVEGTIPESKQYSVFNPVKIEDTTLTCKGYKFQGWEVVNKENVSMIGNSYFVSDGNDIKLKAIWSKVSLKKSMDGKVHDIETILKETPYDEENWISYQGEFWNDTYKLNTTKIVIQNELHPIEGAVEFWDVSEAGDGSVMAYAVLNDDGSTYTIYLQGNGKIIANENSSYLFAYFSKLQNIEGLEYLDTSEVKNMSFMFASCRNLTNLDLSRLNTSNVENMSYMFANCENLINTNLMLDTSNVINMNGMFYRCLNISNLDLSSFNTKNVIDMSGMFCDCHKLMNLDLSNFDTSNVVDMSDMFRYCKSLISLDISNFDTSNVSNMVYMFEQCSNLTKLDLSNFNTSQVTDMSYMFNECSSLTSLNISSFNTSQVTNMSYMFVNCNNLTTLDVSNFNTSKVTDMAYMLSLGYNQNITKLDLSNFDTSNVVNMRGLFASSNYTELDLSNFDTSKVTNTSYMFVNCSNLRTIDFRLADFKTVKNVNRMFANTSNLSVIVKDETARAWIQNKLGSNGAAIIAS